MKKLKFENNKYRTTDICGKVEKWKRKEAVYAKRIERRREKED